MGTTSAGEHCQRNANMAIAVFVQALEQQATDGKVSVQAIRRLALVLTQGPGPLAERFMSSEAACRKLFAPPSKDELPSEDAGRTEPADRPPSPKSDTTPTELSKKPALPTARQHKRRLGLSGLALLGMLALGIGLAFTFGGTTWQDLHSGSEINSQDSAKFANQIINAANGADDAGIAFGIKISKGDHGAVIAEGVPAKLCAASGWALVRKGVLTINGITPRRISWAIINNLCNKADPASLSWTQKTDTSIQKE